LSNLPHYGTVGIVFTWILLTLSLYRVVRFITTDSFPPMFAIRRFIVRGLGEENRWSDVVDCSHCVAVWISILGYLFAAHMLTVPLPVLQAAASMTVIGVISNYDND
jgi:hypothetical protein